MTVLPKWKFHPPALLHFEVIMIVTSIGGPPTTLNIEPATLINAINKVECYSPLLFIICTIKFKNISFFLKYIHIYILVYTIVV